MKISGILWEAWLVSYGGRSRVSLTALPSHQSVFVQCPHASIVLAVPIQRQSSSQNHLAPGGCLFSPFSFSFWAAGLGQRQSSLSSAVNSVLHENGDFGNLTHQFKPELEADEEKVNLAFPPERCFAVDFSRSQWLLGLWWRVCEFLHVAGHFWGWSLITVLTRTNIILICDFSLKSTFI